MRHCGQEFAISFPSGGEVSCILASERLILQILSSNWNIIFKDYVDTWPE